MGQSHFDILNEPVRTFLVPLLEEALDSCVERHQLGEGHGADSYSFGTDAWSLPARLFRDAVGEIPFTIAKGSGFALGFEGIAIHHHRVGESEADDIAVSFPATGQGIRGTILQQQQMFEDSNDQGVAPVVLAYMANPRDGLCAVYLCRVGSVVTAKICEWAETIPVWIRDKDLSSVSRLASVPENDQRPVPEATPMPLVRKRSAEKLNESE